MIPQILDIQKQYQAMVSHTQQICQKIRERNQGFIRFFDIQDRFPREEFYESDEKDIQFLQRNLKEEFPVSLTQKEIISHPILQEFESVIVYLEQTEDQNFVNYKQRYYKFTLPFREMICGHWIAKCKQFKRPLLRQNWKEILFNDKYGTYNKLIKAFHPREKDKYQSRKLSRMPKEQRRDILKNLYTDNKKAHFIQKLVTKREQMKFLEIKALMDCNQKDLQKYQQELQKKLDQMYALQNNVFPVQKPVVVKPVQEIQENTYQPQPVKKIVQQVEIDKGLQFLVASTITLLKMYNFKLEDFSYSKIDSINTKIEQIIKNNKPKVKESISERDVNMRKQPQVLNSCKDLALIRTQYYDQNFLEKFKKNWIFNSESINLANFMEPTQIKKDYLLQQNLNGLMNITSCVNNEFVYGGMVDFNQNDRVMEFLRFQVDRKIGVKSEFDIEEDNLSLWKKNPSESILQEIDLENKLKAFKKKKKKVN